MAVYIRSATGLANAADKSAVSATMEICMVNAFLVS
jgi:hypothetical protein